VNASPLTQALSVALKHCLGNGFVRPLHIAAIAVNGAVTVFRYEVDGDQQTIKPLVEHRAKNGALVLPVNIIVTDARGEAAHMVIRADGTPHMVH
jgi:hypothetical protein